VIGLVLGPLLDRLARPELMIGADLRAARGVLRAAVRP
jgi:hypothetical protein